MTRKRSYKKRKSTHLISRRKLYGGGPSFYCNPINSVIDCINEPLIKQLNTLEQYADIMTINQINNLLEKIQLLPDLNLPEKIQRNIKIFNDIKLKLTIVELEKIYIKFPICKINPKLNNIIEKPGVSRTETITYIDTEPINGTDTSNDYTFSGSGGGKVYINRNKNEAIKSIDTFNRPDEEICYLFYNEATNYNNISSLVCNTNYFCIFKNAYYSNTQNKIYILMEYCGTELFTYIYEKIENNNTIRESQLYKWFTTIAKGIQCMHDNGFVHLDIKPENITINQTTEFISGSLAKLIDFGHAQNINALNRLPNKHFGGTIEYMAPEMKNPSIITIFDYKKCDIYSLGITLQLLLRLILSNDNVSLPDDLQDMLNINPDERPTIQSVIITLENI